MLDDKDTRREGSGVQAVVFALNILEYVAQCQTSVGVSELARAFDTTKSRIHRHLQTLVTAGYLIRNEESERYMISARLMALGQAVSESFELASAARQTARELRDRLGHAVAISQPEKEGNRILLLMPSRSNIDISVKPGSILQFHTSAQGKLTLAFGDAMLLPQVMSARLDMHTPYTISDPEKLKTEIDAVRRRGWAVAPNEEMVGLNALAAPIFDALGHYVGAVAITDSVQFIGEAPTTEQVRQILDAANQISKNLGHRPKAGEARQVSHADENLSGP
ncbi:IclR family transcriptional regulator [Mesorhizobium tianshanense]|uniref:IclR family transcriptional regulator n=1 Tax=Mesorhizobium tianshanense TaxID=39844 RepID=A0A562N724_9HYPH|nr:IclR family transcriptional regulator [Mesorhizobium tianshanense]TWI27900.1 IclR family transcriptional regulator [Mesorhizobium tianshanense]GLS39987.1 IclR family transcriptional regulator [Mesorhizobium tianshanense]